MAFKIRNFYGSPLHSEGFTMDELNKKTKKEQVKSKAQASKLPQIEKPGFDYEMDQDMSYPGGERGRDYDEEGTKKSMSRKASPFNHRDKTGKPIQGDYPGNKQGANHSHPTPIDTSNLSYFDKDPRKESTKRSTKPKSISNRS